MVYKLSKDTNLKNLFTGIDCSIEGSKIMAEKADLNYYFIKGLKCPAANILKQDALSLGADLAVPKGVILCEIDFVDAVFNCYKNTTQTFNQKMS